MQPDDNCPRVRGHHGSATRAEFDAALLKLIGRSSVEFQEERLLRVILGSVSPTFLKSQRLSRASKDREAGTPNLKDRAWQSLIRLIVQRCRDNAEIGKELQRVGKILKAGKLPKRRSKKVEVFEALRAFILDRDARAIGFSSYAHYELQEEWGGGYEDFPVVQSLDVGKGDLPTVADLERMLPDVGAGTINAALDEVAKATKVRLKRTWEG